MNNRIYKKCENEDCNNLVLEGRYCEHCKKIKKEIKERNRKTIGSIIGVIALLLRGKQFMNRKS